MAGHAEGGPVRDATDLDGCADLSDPDRLRALEHTGLTAEPDERLDGFAAWVREALDVPVALVSLVRPDSQIFPGMSGLPEPWAGKRSTPLSHSFCRHVVLTAEPLVVPDARDHPLVRDNLAIPDLGVVAYAGMPLTDAAGNVLGSLCAIDGTPRAWTDTELATLRRIAAACATELRLRLATYDAGREEVRRDRLEAAQKRSFRRSQTLLLASQAFTDTTDVDDVLTRIRALVHTELRPAYVGAVVLDEQHRTVRLADDPVALAPTHTPDLDAHLPSARAMREAAILHYPDRRSFDAANPPAAAAIMRHLGLHSVVAVPLPGTDGPLGSIVLGWEIPNVVEAEDLLTIATIGGYASQALARARILQHRMSVAHALQNAMLTSLPTVDGLRMVARYAPADAREHVGGDWYDAAAVPHPAHPGRPALIVSTGDIIGHDLDAAMIMGQVRSMLRQTAWDHPADPPSAVLRAFEAADHGLHLGARGTAVLARLVETAAGTWTLSWTNAGHPPPILLLPGGTADLLHGHDPLFGFEFTADAPRTDRHREIPPGSTLFLYTDGLVEHRGSDLDVGTEALLDLLRRNHDRPVEDLVDLAVGTLAPDTPDDVVVFAIRFV